ncbi:DNA-binding transcriptional LysR family regulator [Skermanella aerolata]|uniref:LysR family transcriptional regulator n=1 Tax=Skermanella aerolata TaxID=393310 RepID=A0A512DTP7_9PROT|nr:LysR family transcriptional regulator [Skermanella aerolata]KJB92098.1 LysR family transcriptional regulator [Skermanella aerolata KACC 11604]GEO39838.1 LysR family transcriptional regulator [Skermanella aerolata]
MEIRHLRYFVTVAQERNFTRAAEKLHIAQPPLSRQIQQLEEELGIVLLDRDSRPLRLTEAGRLLYEHAAQVLERFDDLRTMMKRFREAERPRFVIGFVASTIYAALPNLIRRFRAETPGLDVSLVEMVSLEQIAALKDGRIDVGFGRIRLDDPAVRRDVLREERLVVALPLSHALLEREGPLSFTELAGEPLILYPRVPRPSYADQVISIFRDRGLEPNIAHEARELQTAIGLVAAEVGICIVPTSVQRLRRDDVVYRELVEQTITSPIIMSRRVNDRSPELAVMSRVIIEAYREWGWKIPEGLDT